MPRFLKKKLERQQQHNEQIKNERETRRGGIADLKKDWADRARKYHEEYNAQLKDLVKVKREAKAKGEYYVEGQPRVILATRIRG
jgi:large subunit ribosomal protein L7e